MMGSGRQKTACCSSSATSTSARAGHATAEAFPATPGGAPRLAPSTASIAASSSSDHPNWPSPAMCSRSLASICLVLGAFAAGTSAQGFTAKLGTMGTVPGRTYAFQKANLRARTGGSYSQLMVAECNKLGMKPVCDGPLHCKDDAAALYIGNTKDLTSKRDRYDYKWPRYNAARWYPRGFLPIFGVTYGIREKWNGLCGYTGTAKGNQALCNIPSNGHNWRTPQQANPGFMCGRGSSFAAALAPKGSGANTTEYVFEVLDRLSTSQAASYAEEMVRACKYVGMKPVCDNAQYCANDAKALYLGQGRYSLADRKVRANEKYMPSGFAAIQSKWSGLCSYTSEYKSNQALCNRPANGLTWQKPHQTATGFVCGRCACDNCTCPSCDCPNGTAVIAAKCMGSPTPIACASCNSLFFLEGGKCPESQPTCNFDQGPGVCGWTLSGHWARGPSTTTTDTGASKAHSGGYFMYLDASQGSDGAVSILTSPTLVPGTKTVEFYYHMHGKDTGELRLEALVNGSWAKVWSKSGQQHARQSDNWGIDKLPLPTGTVRARFRGTKGFGQYGDACLDSVLFSTKAYTPPSCSCARGMPTQGLQCLANPPPLMCESCDRGYYVNASKLCVPNSVNCTFDAGELCGWNVTCATNSSHSTGSRCLSTYGQWAPSATAYQEKRFVMLTTSHGHPDDRSFLTWDNAQADTRSMKFSYVMHRTAGTLAVQAHTAGGNWQTVWTKTGDAGGLTRGCLRPGTDYGASGSCGAAKVIGVMADHLDWKPPKHLRYLKPKYVLNMTSPMSCQLHCQANQACDFFTYHWRHTGSGYFHECYLKLGYRDYDGERIPSCDTYVLQQTDPKVRHVSSGPAVCPIGNYSGVWKDAVAPVPVTSTAIRFMGKRGSRPFGFIGVNGLSASSAAYIAPVCKCPGGNAETGPMCVDNGASLCNSCKEGFVLSESKVTCVRTSNCSGAWTICDVDCAKTFKVISPKQGLGDDCEFTDGETAACLPGEGACPPAPSSCEWTMRLLSPSAEASKPKKRWFTSFEEVKKPQCGDCDPSCSEDRCSSLTLSSTASVCKWSASAACAVPNLGGVFSGFGQGFMTSHTSNGTELGFTAYWQACIDLVKCDPSTMPPPPPSPPSLALWKPADKKISRYGTDVENLNWQVPISSIKVDGDLKDWNGVKFNAQPAFRPCPLKEKTRFGKRYYYKYWQGDGEYASWQGDGKYARHKSCTYFVPFAAYNGGKWNGIKDHSIAVALAWDSRALYFAVKVYDDVHVEPPKKNWQTSDTLSHYDSLQLIFTDTRKSSRRRETYTYSYGYRADKAHAEIESMSHPCPDTDKCTKAAITRDEKANTTTYEIAIPAKALGMKYLTNRLRFGLGLTVSDADDDAKKTQGFSGWAPYGVSGLSPYQKLPAATGTLTLSGESGDTFGVLSATTVTDAWGAAAGFVGDPSSKQTLPDGKQLYVMDDTDGFAFVSVDPVDTSLLSNPTVSIWARVLSPTVTFKEGAAIKIWVDCESGESTMVLFGSLATDLAHMPVGRSGARLSQAYWTKHAAALPRTCGKAKLSFGCVSHNDYEKCFFDMVEFYDRDLTWGGATLTVESCTGDIAAAGLNMSGGRHRRRDICLPSAQTPSPLVSSGVSENVSYPISSGFSVLDEGGDTLSSPQWQLIHTHMGIALDNHMFRYQLHGSRNNSECFSDVDRYAGTLATTLAQCQAMCNAHQGCRFITYFSRATGCTSRECTEFTRQPVRCKMSSRCDRFDETKYTPSAIFQAKWGSSTCTTCVDARTAGSPTYGNSSIFFRQSLNQDFRDVTIAVQACSDARVRFHSISGCTKDKQKCKDPTGACCAPVDQQKCLAGLTVTPTGEPCAVGDKQFESYECCGDGNASYEVILGARDSDGNINSSILNPDWEMRSEQIRMNQIETSLTTEGTCGNCSYDDSKMCGWTQAVGSVPLGPWSVGSKPRKNAKTGPSGAFEGSAFAYLNSATKTVCGKVTLKMYRERTCTGRGWGRRCRSVTKACTKNTVKQCTQTQCYTPKDGDIAYLTSPKLPTGTQSMGFHYHMFGESVGSLSLEALVDKKWVTTRWTAKGAHQARADDKWLGHWLSLPPGAEQVRFKGTLKWRYQKRQAKCYSWGKCFLGCPCEKTDTYKEGDIAIDAVHFYCHDAEKGLDTRRHGVRVNVPTPGILNCSEPRSFWISTTSGNIRVGTGQRPDPKTEFMSWRDPHSKYAFADNIDVMTGADAVGTWSICHTGWRNDWCPPSWTSMFEMRDQFKDGWNGNAATISDCDGTPIVRQVTLKHVGKATERVCHAPKDGYSISVGGGFSVDETSWRMSFATGKVIDGAGDKPVSTCAPFKCNSTASYRFTMRNVKDQPGSNMIPISGISHGWRDFSATITDCDGNVLATGLTLAGGNGDLGGYLDVCLLDPVGPCDFDMLDSLEEGYKATHSNGRSKTDRTETDINSATCGWTQSGPMEWRVAQAAPQHDTGSARAHSGTHFIYLETSNGTTGNTSFLISPVLQDGVVTMKFVYHMFGKSMGSLRVEAHVNESWKSTNWSKNGQQHEKRLDGWSDASLRLPPGASQVRFVATRGATASGDISIDSINFLDDTGKQARQSGFSVAVGGKNDDWGELKSLRWRLRSNVNDGVVVAGEGQGIQSSCTPTPKDCVGSWSQCKHDCGMEGKMYTVTEPGNRLGKPCEAKHNAVALCVPDVDCACEPGYVSLAVRRIAAGQNQTYTSQPHLANRYCSSSGLNVNELYVGTAATSVQECQALCNARSDCRYITYYSADIGCNNRLGDDDSECEGLPHKSRCRLSATCGATTETYSPPTTTYKREVLFGCSPCPPGTISTTRNALNCTACQTGSVPNVGHDACIPARKGWFDSEGNAIPGRTAKAFVRRTGSLRGEFLVGGNYRNLDGSKLDPKTRGLPDYTWLTQNGLERCKDSRAKEAYRCCSNKKHTYGWTKCGGGFEYKWEIRWIKIFGINIPIAGYFARPKDLKEYWVADQLSCAPKSLADATAVCEQLGARLCSRNEANNKCAGGSLGCSGSPVWTTESCDPNQLNGGAILTNTGFTDIRDSVFIGNKAEWGGAIFIGSGSNVSVVDSHFESNAAVNGKLTPTLDDSGVPNGAPMFNMLGVGGAIAGRKCTLRIQKCSFVKNRATGTYGTAIAIGDLSEIDLSDSKFLANTGATFGSALALQENVVARITRCRFTENSGRASGGGIFISDQSRIDILHCEFVKNRATMGAGGAININPAGATKLDVFGGHGEPSVVNIDNCKFVDNSAPVWAGGALFVGDAIVRVTSTQFIKNWAIPDDWVDTCVMAHNGVCNYQAHGEGKQWHEIFLDIVKEKKFPADWPLCPPGSDQHDCMNGEQLYIQTLRPFYMSNITLYPPDKTNQVLMRTDKTSCQYFPCAKGSSCSYANYSLSCTKCPGATVGLDGLLCLPCQPGTEPNSEQTVCVPCEGNTASEIGVCSQCDSGRASNENKTGCLDVSESVLSDPSTAADILSKSNLQPKIELGMAVSAAALVDGSTAQTALKKQLATDLASALGIKPEELEVASIGAGRRRLQSQSAKVKLIVKSSDTSSVVRELSKQLADPKSAIRTKTPIDPSVKPVFEFLCPVGMMRPIGAKQAKCEYCKDGAVPDPDTEYHSCRDCLPGRAPDPATKASCVCDGSHYNASRGTLECFDHLKKWPSEGTSASQHPLFPCLPCDAVRVNVTSSCIKCGLSANGKAFVVTAVPGFAVSQTAANLKTPVSTIGGDRALFQCPMQETCTGDPLQPCVEGYTGPLCTSCADGWSRNGLHGPCSSCESSMHTAWVIFASLLAIAGVTGVLYHVASWDGAKRGKVGTINTLAKILIGLIQILTQLEFTLELKWPPYFAWLLHLLQIFSFDFLAFIDIGCMTTYTFYNKFTLAALMIPLFSGITCGIYMTNKDKAGIENQCAKMILAVIFLSYPFVSTTMFQGMACRDLDSEESWLVMDMQIDCLSAGYTVFTLFALIGICAFPIGIPVLTLMGLLKYSDQVKDPQSAVHERVEFLVGDYKPAFFFWDTLEMLRKVTVTGLLMFVSKGSMFQLVVGILLCLVFLFASAWFQPFESDLANAFKATTEVCLVVTLSLCVMAKVDLSVEDINEDFLGALMIFTNTVVPGVGLAAGMWAFGFETPDGEACADSLTTPSASFEHEVDDAAAATTGDGPDAGDESGDEFGNPVHANVIGSEEA